MPSSNPITEALMVRLATAAPDAVPGTSAQLAVEYGTDEEAMIDILWDLVGLGYVQRQPGGMFVAGPRAGWCATGAMTTTPVPTAASSAWSAVRISARATAVSVACR